MFSVFPKRGEKAVSATNEVQSLIIIAHPSVKYARAPAFPRGMPWTKHYSLKIEVSFFLKGR